MNHRQMRFISPMVLGLALFFCSQGGLEIPLKIKGSPPADMEFEMSL
jgi:hypothetical protein